MSWYFVIFGATFFLTSAGHVVRFFLAPDDIWWTPRGSLVSLGESRDRVEVYVRGVPLQNHLAGQRLQLVSEGSPAPVTGADIGFRFNNWDHVQAQKLPGVIWSSIVAGAAGLVLLIGSLQLVHARRTRRSR